MNNAFPGPNVPIRLIAQERSSTLFYYLQMNKDFIDYLRDVDIFSDADDVTTIFNEFRYIAMNPTSVLTTSCYPVKLILGYNHLVDVAIDIYKHYYIKAVDNRLELQMLLCHKQAYINARKRLGVI
jgi:hypothetical protein